MRTLGNHPRCLTYYRTLSEGHRAAYKHECLWQLFFGLESGFLNFAQRSKEGFDNRLKTTTAIIILPQIYKMALRATSRGLPTTSDFTLIDVKMTSRYDRKIICCFENNFSFRHDKTLTGSWLSKYLWVYLVNCLDFVELQFIPTWETVWKALVRTTFRFYTTTKVLIHPQLANHHRRIRYTKNTSFSSWTSFVVWFLYPWFNVMCGVFHCRKKRPSLFKVNTLRTYFRKNSRFA